MKKIVAIIQGPSITETGRIGRVVEFADGSGQTQTYGPRDGWQRGGVSVLSMFTAEPADRSNLAKRRLSEKQIEEILWDPEKDRPSR